MRVLIYGDNLALAPRLMSEGHDICEGYSEADLILFDSVGQGPLADDLRSQGYNVLGSSVFGDRLELDRDYGQVILEAANVPTTTEPVDLGIEVTIEGWFNGNDWVLPFTSAIDDRRLCSGDLGPDVGWMSSTVWAWQHMRPRVARETLLRLTSLLRKAEYVGPLAIHTKGGYATHFSSGFRPGAFYAFSELVPHLGDFLYRVAKGTAKSIPTSKDFAFALRTLLLSLVAGVPVGGIKSDEPHYWFRGVAETEQGLVTADSFDCTVTGRGTLEEAQRSAFSRAEGLQVPDLLWRSDAGQRARRQVRLILDTYVK